MDRILVTGMPPGANGIATSMLNLYRHIDRDRFQMDFLLRSKYKDFDWKETHQDEIEKLGGRVFWCDYSRYEFPRRSREAFRIILDEHRDITGIHMCALGLPYIFPITCAREKGLPIKVIHCHTAPPKSRMHIPTKAELRCRAEIKGDDVERLACSDISGRFLYGDMPYRFFPNAVDLTRFYYNPVYRSALRRSLNIDEQIPVLGIVGDVSRYKNPKFALRIFRAFKDVHKNAEMLVVGRGFDLKEVMEYARSLRVISSVHFVGMQYEAEFFYNAMDALLMPSLSEGLPNVVVEAQATGLPCLISDEVSEMAALTPLAEFIPLSLTPRKWAEAAWGAIGKNIRRSYGNEIRANGYDIRDSARALMDIYEGMAESSRR